MSMTTELETGNPNSGHYILEQLKKSGSDLNKKHEISFWLYMPNKDAALQAAKRARATGLEVDIATPNEESESGDWLCLLYCPHIPDEQLLDGISQFCIQLADELKGRFDGWESSLELPDHSDRPESD
jgi:regulator of RNase E activity RraB